MAPLTKDLTDITSSSAEPAASQAPPAARTVAAHLRSDALSLEIPVNVHGSKVTEVVREITPHTEPFEEQTTTMIVFPQGAVLKMSTIVSPGQMLVVTNQRSKQDSICRVLKVRAFSSTQAYVEVEFTHRQPGYWGVYFPSDGPTTAHATPAAHEEVSQPAAQPQHASAPPVIAPAAEKKAPVIVPPPESRPSSAPSLSSVASSKPETVFAPIGSHEEVEAPATATGGLAPARPPLPADIPSSFPKSGGASHGIGFHPAVPPSIPSPASRQEPQSHRAPSASISAPAPSHSLGAHSEIASHAADSSPALGGLPGGLLSGVASRTYHAPVEESHSLRTDVAHSPTGASQNWLLIVLVALLFTVVGGGIVYLRLQSSNHGAAAPNPAVTRTSAANASAQLAPPAAASSVVNSSPSAALNGPLKPAAIVRAHSAESVSEAKPPASQSGPAAEPAAPKSSPSALVSGSLSKSLNLHPLASKRSAGSLSAGAAPDVSVNSGSSAEALPGIFSSNAAMPPAPPVAASGPVHVGGMVKQPRLISRVLPIYPIGAKSSNVQGDVVIAVLIAKDGSVTNPKVISGPSLLRQAAVDAVRHWKYEPSRLDGEPIAVEMQVTVGFHM